MIYSKTCEYAIRALKDLASRPGGGPAAPSQVSQRTGVPRAYLSKIFQCLVRAGVLSSRGGPGGGNALRVDPARLTLCRVIEALDDAAGSPLSNCVMGRSECSDRSPCSLHPIWADARGRIAEALRRETVADLLRSGAGTYPRRARRSRLSRRMKQVFSMQRKPNREGKR